MKKMVMDPCPRCRSLETGIIQPLDGFSTKTELTARLRSTKAGYLIKQISPEEYRDRYACFFSSQSGSCPAFCHSCGYEFIGHLHPVFLEKEELVQYEREHGLFHEKQEVEHLRKRRNPAAILIEKGKQQVWKWKKKTPVQAERKESNEKSGRIGISETTGTN